jgi:hypothetical protein
MSSLRYDALIKKFEAEIAEAKATLEIYFASAVGIGEHPQIIDEMNKQLENLSCAEGKLQSLQALVNVEQTQAERGTG